VLIQKTRALQSLPGFSDAELTIHVATWRDALSDIPDLALSSAWERATREHDWSRPFPVPSIVGAYRALVAEHNEKLEAERKYQQYRRPTTFRCRWCGDTGYAPLAIPCPTRGDVWHGRRACECEATPIAQRLPSILTTAWRRDEKEYWTPPAGEHRCQCVFCRNKPRGEE